MQSVSRIWVNIVRILHSSRWLGWTSNLPTNAVFRSRLIIFRFRYSVSSTAWDQSSQTANIIQLRSIITSTQRNWKSSIQSLIEKILDSSRTANNGYCKWSKIAPFTCNLIYRIQHRQWERNFLKLGRCWRLGSNEAKLNCNIFEAIYQKDRIAYLQYYQQVNE